MHTTSITHLYGEEFAMRVSPITMPWGTVYILIELVLMYSETSYRLVNDGKSHWCAIEDTFDRALVKACAEIQVGMG